MRFWGKKPSVPSVSSNEVIETDSSSMAMHVVDTFRVFPAVTVRTVCFYSTQDIYEFAKLMVELFTKAGTKIYGYSSQQIFNFSDEAENAKASIVKAVKTNPALGKEPPYNGRIVSFDNSITDLNTLARQIKSEDLLPNDVIILPICGVDIKSKEFEVEKTFELIKSLETWIGNRDYHRL